MILVMAFILPNKQLYVMEMDVSKVFPLKKNKNKTNPPCQRNKTTQNKTTKQTEKMMKQKPYKISKEKEKNGT